MRQGLTSHSSLARAELGDDKKRARAARFGLPVRAAPEKAAHFHSRPDTLRATQDVVAEQQRKEARAARYVTSVCHVCAQRTPDLLCAPRFGEAAVAAAEKALAGAKREAPAPVVVDPEFEAKKAKRAERFGSLPEAAK